MPYIFRREGGKLTKTETRFPVEVVEVRDGPNLLAYAQVVSANVMQRVLLAPADARLLKDDPDWTGPKPGRRSR